MFTPIIPLSELHQSQSKIDLAAAGDTKLLLRLSLALV